MRSEIGIKDLRAKIKVLGVGGGGGNAINNMVDVGVDGVNFIAANSDYQALLNNKSDVKIRLGETITRGLGAGASPDVGRQATLEAKDEIEEALEGADMVFITAGMGGGTGTGGAPIIAAIAKNMGILTVSVVTKPFLFEGKKRMRVAEQGLLELKECVDTLITIPNQKLLTIASKDMAFLESFRRADNILIEAVKGISDLIVHPGLINLDLADVRTIMSETGLAIMGVGVAEGENRSIEAARMAVFSNLLEDGRIGGAKGILINITGGSSLTMYEINEAATLIQEEAHEDANIIFGAVINESMGDKIRITLIATGFGGVTGKVQPTIRSNSEQTRQDSMHLHSTMNDRKVAPIDKDYDKTLKESSCIFDLNEDDDKNEEDYDIPTFLRRQLERH